VLRRLQPAARAYVDVVRQHRPMIEDVPGEGH
jgi:hypothetical protein